MIMLAIRVFGPSDAFFQFEMLCKVDEEAPRFTIPVHDISDFKFQATFLVELCTSSG